MARTSLYDLSKTGDKIMLEGTLVYSALRNKQKLQNPTPFDQDARYRITIADPKVVKGEDTDLGKNILKEDISHGAYESKSGKYAGHTMWSFNSKSKFPINIYSTKTGDDAMPANEFLKAELASGQKVGILFSVYEGKVKGLGTQYKSGSLDGVVIEDPENIKYFGEGGGNDYSDFFGPSKNKLSDFAEGDAADANEEASQSEANNAAESEAEKPAAKDEGDEKKKLKKETDDLF